MTLEEYILDYAKKHNVSRTRAINMFADTCGVSDNTMQNYMRPGAGRCKPSLKTIKKIIFGSNGKITLDDFED